MQILTIVVTGVSRGLGRELAEQLARDGHVLLGCARSKSGLDQLAKRCQGGRYQLSTVDVADGEAVSAWAGQLLTQFGAPDLVINNAGVINNPQPLWEIPPGEISQLFDINIKGVCNVVRAFLPAMIAQGQGGIINFSSEWGRSTSPEVAPYCASKWAIEGLTQALAQELPTGLFAVPVNPGIIDTDMLRTCFGADARSYPAPSAWAKRAVPYLLSLGRKDNGKPRTIRAP